MLQRRKKKTVDSFSVRKILFTLLFSLTLSTYLQGQEEIKITYETSCDVPFSLIGGATFPAHLSVGYDTLALTIVDSPSDTYFCNRLKVNYQHTSISAPFRVQFKPSAATFARPDSGISIERINIVTGKSDTYAFYKRDENGVYDIDIVAPDFVPDNDNGTKRKQWSFVIRPLLGSYPRLFDYNCSFKVPDTNTSKGDEVDSIDLQTHISLYYQSDMFEIIDQDLTNITCHELERRISGQQDTASFSIALRVNPYKIPLRYKEDFIAVDYRHIVPSTQKGILNFKEFDANGVCKIKIEESYLQRTKDIADGNRDTPIEKGIGLESIYTINYLMWKEIYERNTISIRYDSDSIKMVYLADSTIDIINDEPNALESTYVKLKPLLTPEGHVLDHYFIDSRHVPPVKHYSDIYRLPPNPHGDFMSLLFHTVFKVRQCLVSFQVDPSSKGVLNVQNIDLQEGIFSGDSVAYGT